MCFANNWDLELKHRGGRWCVGFSFCGCVCIKCMNRKSECCVCVLECPYSNSVSGPRRYRGSMWSEPVLIPGQLRPDLRPICHHYDRCVREWLQICGWTHNPQLVFLRDCPPCWQEDLCQTFSLVL